jgi:hypothetical protein
MPRIDGSRTIEIEVVRRFDWDEPTELRWRRIDGDVKDLVGSAAEAGAH